MYNFLDTLRCAEFSCIYSYVMSYFCTNNSYRKNVIVIYVRALTKDIRGRYNETFYLLLLVIFIFL